MNKKIPFVKPDLNHKIPDFERLHHKFLKQLERNRIILKPTEPVPFKLTLWVLSRYIYIEPQIYGLHLVPGGTLSLVHFFGSCS